MEGRFAFLLQRPRDPHPDMWTKRMRDARFDHALEFLAVREATVDLWERMDEGNELVKIYLYLKSIYSPYIYNCDH